MRKLIGIVLLFLLVSVVAVAQEDKAEVFGGYQYTRLNTGVSGVDSINLNGWNASVSGYFTKNLGISADFSGAYGSPFGVSTRMYPFMFGPIVHLPNSSKITPFAHALFGAAHLTASASGVSAGETDFAWAAGGGLDAHLNSRYSVRLAQFDFLQTRFGGDNQNNFRYSAGILIKF